MKEQSEEEEKAEKEGLITYKTSFYDVSEKLKIMKSENADLKILLDYYKSHFKG